MDQRTFNSDGSGISIQGDNNSNFLENVTVTVGSTYSEKQKQIEGIDELITLLQQESSIPEKEGAQAVKHLGKVKDEIAEEEEPDTDFIEKSFKKVNTIVELAEKGSSLIEKVMPFFALFGA